MGVGGTDSEVRWVNTGSGLRSGSSSCRGVVSGGIKERGMRQGCMTHNGEES